MCLGQTEATNVFPLAPEQANFEKFVNHPVNLSKGIPTIEIPLWQIKEKGFTLPISLKYHAGGIKVSEVASMAGLGWSLSAGGMVSRALHGSPDEEYNGYSNAGLFPFCPNDLGPDEYQFVEANQPDLQPDMFTYSASSGISGNFVIHQNQEVRQIPMQNVVITRDMGTQQWTITDDKGIIYEFAKPEQTYTAGSTTTSPYAAVYTSGWHLTKIRFPWLDASHDIVFEYISYSNSSQYITSETKSEHSFFNRNVSTEVNQSNSWRLSKITYAGGEVLFNAGGYRHDLKGGLTLDRVLVKNKSGQTIKNFKLNYNYFAGNAMTEFTQLPAATANTAADNSLRLSLKSVQEFAGDSQSESLPPYNLFYENSIWLPNRVTSKALDHWGYYNGRNSNQSLIPSMYIQNGGYRAVDSVYAKAGVLKKIVYPTKGYTTYRYGSNRLNPTVNKSYDEFIYEDKNVSGSVGSCHTQAATNFEVKNDLGAGISFNFQLTYQGGNGGSYTCSSGVPISPTNTSTYLEFRIFNVNDLTNQVNQSTLGVITGQSYNPGFSIQAGTLFLPNGNYVLKLYNVSTGQEVFNGQYSIINVYQFTMTGRYKIITPANSRYILAGGLRVEETKTYDSDGTLEKFNSYEYVDQYGNASGITNKFLNYEYLIYFTESGGQAPPKRIWNSQSANSDFSDSTTYSNVTVYEGKNSDSGQVGVFGKTEYTFSTPRDFIIDHSHLGPNDHNAFHSTIVITNPGPNCATEAMLNSGAPLPQSPGIKYPYVPTVSQAWREGLLLNETTFKRNPDSSFTRVKETVNTYKDDYYGSNVIYNIQNDVIGAKVATYAMYIGTYNNTGSIYYKGISYYYYPSRLYRLTSTTTRNFLENSTIETIANNTYGAAPYYQLLSTQTTNSLGQSATTEYKYPTDLVGVEQTPYMQDLVTANRIAEPVITKAFNAGAKLSENHTKYGNSSATGNLLQPIEIHSRKGADNIVITSTTDRKILYTKYDAKGNILEYKPEGGTTVSIIWGYNGQYPVAKLENIAYANIPANLVTDIQTATDSPTSTEAGVLAALNALRNSTNANIQLAFITTYTYKPLAGVTSITDTKGYKTTYLYDDFGRLKEVRDQDNNILSENEYHYRQQ